MISRRCSVAKTTGARLAHASPKANHAASTLAAVMIFIDSVVGLSTCGTGPASRTLVPTTGIPFAAIVLRSETVTAHGFLHSDATPRRVLRTRRRGATDAGAIAGFSP